ncbi:DUF2829 domain-containing protein [Xenorhabdus sp. PR6a]|uniref:Thoeris anti-defense Tad2 family protein n=1 Tax=Xenorhabdus sp. PR6a TaxID=3025877 RepID=UPI002359FD94|nr:MW1434 family type I TA system toxin [Xenorhabdus sp. PR6a]MDC9582948.1 DUF2829 domain-containing protein [Xenorhabdus sp. PR6a]
MSEINKLDNTACPFNPEHYKIEVITKVNHDLAAPTGSLPWALIQVYLGHQVRRNGWDSQIEYIKLIPGSTGSDGSNVLPQIEMTDKDGATSWQPTQEDLIACDWKLMDCMLSFDLKVGTTTYDYGQSQAWGYLNESWDASLSESPFGTLTNIQSTMGVGGIILFYLEEQPINNYWGVELQVTTQSQLNLPNKSLEVTVNGSTYHLGSSNLSPGSSTTTDFTYTADGAKQLGEILKQNVDKTLHFCFNWQ